MRTVVDLHVWSLAASGAHDRYLATLSPDEHARKNRFVFDRDRDAFVAGRGRLREILSGELGVPPADVVFDYGPNGKPAVAGGPSFNLSHAGGIACLAVHADQPLGVDIEAHREIERDVAKRFFSPVEYAALMALPEADRKAAFFRCWTRKEAVIKALGGGLSIPLGAFDVSLDECAARLERLDIAHGVATEWSMAAFEIGEAMPGAVTVKTAQGAQLFLASCDPGIAVTF